MQQIRQQRVAVIFTGLADSAGQTLPLYLDRIQRSQHRYDLFGSFNGSGQALADFQDHFADTVQFDLGPHRFLPNISASGYISICQFAHSIDHWWDRLDDYDLIWRVRWDCYLEGGDDLLDTVIAQICAAREEEGPLMVITRNIDVRQGLAAMEGKMHWLTVSAAKKAYHNWRQRWFAWQEHIHRASGSAAGDAHVLWAQIYSTVGCGIKNALFDTVKIQGSPYPQIESLEPVSTRLNISTPPTRPDHLNSNYRKMRKKYLEELVRWQIRRDQGDF